MSSKMILMAASLTHTRPVTSAAARLVPQPADLIKWVRKEGGFVHQSIKIAHLESDPNGLGLGLVACNDIPKGSELIALPHRIPLKFEDKNEDYPLLMNLARHIPEELWAMKLGLKLLQERSRKSSFWWTYISNLPETYTVPIFFPGEDIKNLQYAPLLHQVNKRCRFLLDFERLLRNELAKVELDGHPFGGQDVDASSLGWAMSAVSSRAFRLYGDKRPDGTHFDAPMLLPLVDMCNHSFNPNAEILQEKEPSNKNILVKVIAAAQIKQDDPLVLNYGCLNNDLFLLDYGFVMPSNPYDCIELKYDSDLLDAASTVAGVSAPNISSPSSWQQRILHHLKLHGEMSDLKVRIGGSEVVEGRLLAALRVLLSKDEEAVEKLNFDALKSLSSEAPLGIPTEVAALRTLIALCAIALEHFPSKITEDETVLKKNISITTELAVRYRIQKKFVIIDAMRDLTRRVKQLSSMEPIAVQ
ncbi:histone-lysine N-methyltransferase setd3 [Dorcoceras hygrometricum]|uniref:Histone-lysine N-methyltransferase setd3 n=1 Tax=Dorcoceras hygrometricum TaxID=472368 RepID=A0A2Z7AJX2_9LAMI|nr:histone-lysine N-methyltransferase setd3 [Dorcoceras hygrometricum]